MSTLRKTLLTVWVVPLVAVTVGSAGHRGPGPVSGSGTNGGPEPGDRSRPIVNRVLDLLGDDVALTTEGGETRWVSTAFDTSQFDRIGIRFSADTANGSVSCAVAWRFSDEDAFMPGAPRMALGAAVSLMYPYGPDGYIRWLYPTQPAPGETDPAGDGDGGPLDPIDDPSLYPGPAGGVLVLGPSPEGFAEVQGTSARVECSLLELGRSGILGDDTGSGEPLPPAGVTLTDVKVLLRR